VVAVARAVTLSYTIPSPPAGWELSEESMPESPIHDAVVKLLIALLDAWAALRGKTSVFRNIAVRWDEGRPAFGVDPDVCVVSPPPPPGIRSLQTWLPEHATPFLAVEVVSETNPHKDYNVAPDKYAASGIGELVIFDPLLAGPATHGGPYTLQVWQRSAAGGFARVYAGAGPAPSRALGAHLFVEGDRLRIADRPDGGGRWLTGEEAALAAKEAALVAKEAALAAKETALARVAELEAELRRR
jgi:Uma2 family endonuclease